MPEDGQHGAAKNKCCQTNLISYSGLQWAKEKALDGIYLDFSHVLLTYSTWHALKQTAEM